jgi:hypothetical protein
LVIATLVVVQDVGDCAKYVERSPLKELVVELSKEQNENKELGVPCSQFFLSGFAP